MTAVILSTATLPRKSGPQILLRCSTQSALQKDKNLLDDYKIDGVPTLAVQGKYETGPAATNSLPGTIQVLDYLVAQVRAKKM